MKLLNAPRQPFVGLALMAATGIAVAEIIPLRSSLLILAAIILGICILIALRWPKLAATYLIVGVGFFLLHKFATRTLLASNSQTNLASGRASSQQSDP